MATMVLVHGSWHNGTAWRKLQAVLDGKNVVSYAPTLTGFDSLATPAGPDIGLHAHIRDIIDLIQSRSLDDVILVGHSYAGLVIAGVAEEIPDKVAALVFLDAFIPDDKQSLFDILGDEAMAGMRASLVDAAGRGVADGVEAVWLLSPGQPQDYGVTDPQDVEWVRAQMVYTPVLTFEERVSIANPAARMTPRYFIRCTDFPFLAPQEQKAIAAQWKTYRLATGHDAMVTVPEEVAAILLEIAVEQGG